MINYIKKIWENMLFQILQSKQNFWDSSMEAVTVSNKWLYENHPVDFI